MQARDQHLERFDEEIFDDSDFYSKLLRELIDSGTKVVCSRDSKAGVQMCPRDSRAGVHMTVAGLQVRLGQGYC